MGEAHLQLHWEKGSKFIERIVPCDKIWAYHCIPESKRAS
jgi:hypothetical protein